MRLRDWIDPNTADMLIPAIGMAMLLAPVVGAAIGACFRDASGSRKHGAALGFAIGVLVAFGCFVAMGQLVREYWAG